MDRKRRHFDMAHSTKHIQKHCPLPTQELDGSHGITYGQVVLDADEKYPKVLNRDIVPLYRWGWHRSPGNNAFSQCIGRT